jgi:hypothetical protein
MRVTMRAVVGDRDDYGTSSSLGEWYKSVADVPIEELHLSDLCRALRQGLALEYLVPLALGLISNEAKSGALFDGELVSVVARIPRDFWIGQSSLYREAALVALGASLREGIDDDVRGEIQSFVREAPDRPAPEDPAEAPPGVRLLAREDPPGAS